MPRCPNCGQKTARTEDWVCQWCGYPLPSGGYKKIDKTYRQLRDEENFGAALDEVEEKVVEPVHNAEPEPFPRRHPEPEVEPVREPEPETVPETEPASPPAPEPPAPSLLYQTIVSPPRTAEPAMPTRPEPVSQPLSQVSPPRLEPETELTPGPAPIALPPQREQETGTAQFTPQAQAMPEAPRPVPPEPEPAMQTVTPPSAPAPLVTPPPQPQPVTAPQRPNPLLTQPAIPDNTEISAAEIAAAYHADKVAVDAKLRNKVIRVTGAIGKMVIREHLDIVYLILTDAHRSDMWNIRCTFDKKYGTQLRRFNLGDIVTIQGRYDGYERNIILKDCVP